MSVLSDLLSDYIKEILADGFDSQQKLAYMLRKLKDAAELDYKSNFAMDKDMRKTLETYFKRGISKSRLAKSNPKVSILTVDRIMPSLRAELDRRIMANADMIKINRSQAIDKTLQRFSGWATSIPKGGTKAASLSDVKADITKTARQLKYELKRREIDQGHKLISSIGAVIGMQTNAIAMEWHSNWKQAGYDYRPDHKDRDGKVYAIRDNWAIQKGYMKVDKNGYNDSITAPAEEVFCRCQGSYITNLRDLPESMLTEKGRQFLNADNE